MSARKKKVVKKKAAPRTPTTLAERGLKSADGVSPSGFELKHRYHTPETYQAERGSKPRFLNIVQGSEAPCVDCTSYCCRARVVINIPDLVRLSGPLAIHPFSLCDLTEADSRNGEPVLIGDTPKHMVLRRGEDEHCQLLLTVDGLRRCGVHAIRPGICRVYPFSYVRGSMTYELGHVMCPTQWILSKERQDRVLDDVECYEQDRALDRRIVKAFNQRPVEERTALAFWEHAMREGGKALGQDVSFMFRVPPRTQLKPALW
jgi:Fe-S-cluster containining protein